MKTSNIIGQLPKTHEVNPFNTYGENDIVTEDFIIVPELAWSDLHGHEGLRGGNPASVAVISQEFTITGVKVYDMDDNVIAVDSAILIEALEKILTNE